MSKIPSHFPFCHFLTQISETDKSYQVENLVERVPFDQCFKANGYLYFYDKGGPVLNKWAYNHYEGHKDWFRAATGKNWDSKGKYLHDENELS